MAMAGDLKNNLRRLQSKLKLVSYPKDMDIKGISKGLAQEFLPILHYVLLDFSRPMAEYMMNNDIELYGKSDAKFMIAVYKVFRDIFHYKPSITRQQFFSFGYAEHKIILVVDLIRMVKEKHKELCKTLPKTVVHGSLGRIRSGPSKEQNASSKPVPDPDQPTTPDLLTPSSNEPSSNEPSSNEPSSNEPPPVFPPPNGDGVKAAEMDIGYHTAETSPTFKTRDEQEERAKRPCVSLNVLRAKFEASRLHQEESSDRKLSDTDLEEHPVIQALVKHIVHLEEQLTAAAEEAKAWRAKADERHGNMQAHMVLMQNAMTLLESKVSTGTDPAQWKPVRPRLAQGVVEDIPMAFLRPNQRRPENIPLPESPVVPRTTGQAPSSAQTPPPPALSISAVDPNQDSPPAGDSTPEWYPAADDPPEQAYRPCAPAAREGGDEAAISVVGSPAPVADPVEVVTVIGAASPSPMDVAWARPCSSTPNEAASSSQDARNGTGMEAGDLRPRGSATDDDDDDIDEGLVDVEDGDLGEYIQETATDYSGEMWAGREVGQAGAAEEAEEAGLEEDEVDKVPVRDVGQMEPPASEYQQQAVNVNSQIQRVQDMLTSTQQLLAMNDNLTPAPATDDQLQFTG